jgi:hypothetical protein
MRTTLTLLLLVPLVAPTSLAAQDSAADREQVPFYMRAAPKPTDGLMADRGKRYRPVRPGEVRAASFLTETAALPFGEALGTTEPPTVRVASLSAVVALGSGFAVRPPEGGSYRVGDTLMIARLDPGPRGWGQIVVPTGQVVVESIGARQTLTRITAVYGPVRSGQVVLPVPPLVDPGAVTPSDAAGPSGTVIAPQAVRELLMPGSEIYVSLGGASGVAIGDFVEIRRTPGPRLNAADATDDVLARGQILHVGTDASTVRLTRLVSPVIPAGSTVRRTAALPH